MVGNATRVRFDVLIVADGAQSPADPGAPPRPSGQRVEHCRRWFAARGADCHPTSFGLACTMSRSQAEALFGAAAVAGAELPAPAEVAGLIEQITVPAEPELF